MAALLRHASHFQGTMPCSGSSLVPCNYAVSLDNATETLMDRPRTNLVRDGCTSQWTDPLHQRRGQAHLPVPGGLIQTFIELMIHDEVWAWEPESSIVDPFQGGAGFVSVLCTTTTWSFTQDPPPRERELSKSFTFNMAQPLPVQSQRSSAVFRHTMI